MHSGNQVVVRVLAIGLAAAVIIGATALDASGKSPAARSSAEATSPDTAPPRSHLQPVGEMVRAPAGVGLRMARATQVLRDQLMLARGAGLVIEAVQPESAAARAGFMVNDVLVRVDDQWMLLPEQFAAFVEAADEDTALACHVLRGGKPVVLTLGDATAAVVAHAAAPPVRTLRQPESSARSLLPRARGADAPAPPVATLAADAPAAGSAETLVRNDADYQIRLTVGDEMRLVVTDRQGRLVFNDCIDTPEARSRLPLAVRDRVDQMERHLERHDAPRHRPVAEIGRLDVQPIRIR